MPKRIIRVTIRDREDGGVEVSSDDLKGLVLSGRNRTAILANIEAAARAILMRKGEDATCIRIDATFVRERRMDA